MGLAVLGAGLGMAVTLLTGQVVGAVPGVIDGRPGAMPLGEFSWLLAALLAVFVIDSLSPALQQVASLMMDAGLVRAIGTGITEPLLRPRRIEHLEDAEVLDVQERAKGKGGFHLAQGMSQLPWLLASRVTLLGSAVIVGAMFRWWVAAMLVGVTLLLEWYGGRLVEREVDVWWATPRSSAARTTCSTSACATPRRSSASSACTAGSSTGMSATGRPAIARCGPVGGRTRSGRC
jgi:ATP-binding cassette subfamily B protein